MSDIKISRQVLRQRQRKAEKLQRLLEASQIPPDKRTGKINSILYAHRNTHLYGGGKYYNYLTSLINHLPAQEQFRIMDKAIRKVSRFYGKQNKYAEKKFPSNKNKHPNRKIK